MWISRLFPENFTIFNVDFSFQIFDTMCFYERKSSKCVGYFLEIVIFKGIKYAKHRIGTIENLLGKIVKKFDKTNSNYIKYSDFETKHFCLSEYSINI